MTAAVKKTWWARNKGKVLTAGGYAATLALAIAGKRVVNDLQDQIADLEARTEMNEMHDTVLFDEIVDLGERSQDLRDDLDWVAKQV